MKNGTSTHAPLHQTVNSFFGGVKQFAAHAEGEARDLRTSVEKPPLSGTQGYSSLFMKRMKTDVSRLQKDVATMHSQFTSAVSFEEIIEVCMGMYKQNEMWREELEEVLEQEHGLRRVEPPPLLSPANSHDEKDRGEESADPDSYYYSQMREETHIDESNGERGETHQYTSDWDVNKVERVPGERRAAAVSHTPKQSSRTQPGSQSGTRTRHQPTHGSSRPAPAAHNSNPLLYSPSADLGLSAASLELISRRPAALELQKPSAPVGESNTGARMHQRQMGTDAQLSSFSSSVAAPSSTSSFAQPTSTYHRAAASGKTPTPSSHYASFSSSSSSMSAYSNASSSAPKTPTSSYRPSYAMVASPEYTASYQSKTPQHHGNTSGRYTSATPGSVQRGHHANASMSAMTPVTPITRSFHGAENGGAGDMDFDDLSPIRPSAGGQLYPSLPTTTPTVDLRYKHLLGNSPAQPAAARGAAPPAFSSLYPSSSSYSSSASSSSISSTASAYSKYSSSVGPSSTTTFVSSSAPTYSSSSYASSLPALSSTSTAWSSTPAAQAPTSSSSSKALPPASLIPTVTEQEYNGCAGFLRGQISLQQLNEAIEKMGAFCAANSLPHLSEDQLRNDLGLGSKCKAAILFLLQLKRITSQFHSGASVYVPT